MFVCSFGVVLAQDTVSFFMRHSELEKNLQMMFKTAPKASFMKGYAFNFHVAKLIISHTSASFQWVNCIEKELRRNAENKRLWKSRFYKNPLISSSYSSRDFPLAMNRCNFPFCNTNGVFIFLLLMVAEVLWWMCFHGIFSNVLYPCAVK